MNEQSQHTDEEYHDLAAKHHELDERLSQLTAKHYLSEPEQLEEATLKKRKLQLKDRMEDIIRLMKRAPDLRAQVAESPIPKLVAVGSHDQWPTEMHACGVGALG